MKNKSMRVKVFVVMAVGAAIESVYWMTVGVIRQSENVNPFFGLSVSLVFLAVAWLISKPVMELMGLQESDEIPCRDCEQAECIDVGPGMPCCRSDECPVYRGWQEDVGVT